MCRKAREEGVLGVHVSSSPSTCTLFTCPPDTTCSCALQHTLFTSPPDMPCSSALPARSCALPTCPAHVPSRLMCPPDMPCSHALPTRPAHVPSQHVHVPSRYTLLPPNLTIISCLPPPFPVQKHLYHGLYITQPELPYTRSSPCNSRY